MKVLEKKQQKKCYDELIYLFFLLSSPRWWFQDNLEFPVSPLKLISEMQLKKKNLTTEI